MRTVSFLLIMSAWAISAEGSPHDLLAAVAKGPYGTSEYQPSLGVPDYVFKSAEYEIAHSVDVQHALEDLAPAREPKDWVEALHKWKSAVKALEHERAVWCLQVCLCHPQLPVTTDAVEALIQLKNVKAVPFLLTFAEYENTNAPMVGGRNIVMYQKFAERIAEAFVTLTGLPKIRDEDSFHPLAPNLPQWRKWVAEHPIDGA